MSGTSTLEARRGTTGDRAFVRSLAAEVFSRFGPYERTLPPLLADPAITTWVLVRDGKPVGFAMWGREALPRADAELIAIAVSPRDQARGVGRLLLEAVESEVRRADPPIACVRLSVADDNSPARHLFECAGFHYLDEDQGYYPGGQVSLGMAKRLDDPP